MNKLKITWEEVFQRLSQYDNTGQLIYGVPKGGMIITSFLKNAYTTHDPKQATLIIDDLIDSGATKEKYQQMYPLTPFVGLFDKQAEGITDWVIFPWESDHPMQNDSIEQNIVRILQYLGEDVNREGLKETPQRVVRMYNEIFRGYDKSAKPKVTVFQNGKDKIIYDQMIIDSGEFYSHCEHHMVPFFGHYWFAYVPSPRGAIIGLSKVARLVDYHSARLQVQERLVSNIVDDIWNILSTGFDPPLGIALIMKAEHLCKTMRGARKKGFMTTSNMKGVFLTNPTAREELMQLIKG